MPFSERKLIAFYFLYFAAMVGWSLVLFLTHQKTTDWNYLFNVADALIYLTGGLIALTGSRRLHLKNSLGRELTSVGIGVILFGIGLSIWSYYNLALRIESPYPSLSDAVYVFYSPILAFGLINLLRVFGVMIAKRFYFESLGIFIVTSVLIITIGGPPDLASDLTFLAKFLNIYYLLADALLITLGTMIIRLTHGRIHGSFFFFLIALFSMAIADFTFFYRTTQEIYWNGDIADIFYALAGTMFAIGIIKIVAAQERLSTATPSTPPAN